MTALSVIDGGKEEKPVLYLVVNKGLNMSPGKVAAQVAHATMGIHVGVANWLDHPHRWVIILEAKDEAHLWSIQAYLEERGLVTYLVVDEGVNEIPPLSATILAVEVLDKDGSEAKYLSGLSKYQYQEREAQYQVIPYTWVKWRHRGKAEVTSFMGDKLAIYQGYKDDVGVSE